MAEIVVMGEVTGGALDPITGEMVAAAKGLRGPVGVAVMGVDLDGVGEQAIALGADEVFLVQDPLLTERAIDAHVAAFEQLCMQTTPRVVLAGKTELGREVGPRVAFRLGAGVAQDSVEVKLDPDSGRVVATRPVYGGDALATVEFGEVEPQFVVLRGNSYEPPTPDPSRTGEVMTISPELDPAVVRVRSVEIVRQESEGMRLEDAPVVVSGGRGIAGPDGFKDLAELAAVLRGAVAASRGACDAGWIDHSYQVGLTGKTVTPDVYLAVGISGASQHMAGCSGARHIVAVNTDTEANIFKAAEFGVVGDWTKVIPAFVETARELVTT